MLRKYFRLFYLVFANGVAIRLVRFGLSMTVGMSIRNERRNSIMPIGWRYFRRGFGLAINETGGFRGVTNQLGNRV